MRRLALVLMLAKLGSPSASAKGSPPQPSPPPIGFASDRAGRIVIDRTFS